MTAFWGTVEMMASTIARKRTGNVGVVCGGLQGGDCVGAGCWFFALHHALEQLVDGALASFSFADFGAWGEDA
jgi:hypothetical protein